MEAKVLAAVLAFAILVGIGIGWQLPKREASPVTLERTLTVTLTSLGTVTETAMQTVTVRMEGARTTVTVYERGMTTTVTKEVTTTVTIAKTSGPLLYLLLPSAFYDCNRSSLSVAVAIANVGNESVVVDINSVKTALEGASEAYKIALPGTAGSPEVFMDQTTLKPGEHVFLNVEFEVTDFAEFSKHVRRGPYDALLIHLNLTIPYSWRGGSSTAVLMSAPLEVFGDCKAEFLR
jgi:hypothetical protein